MRQLLLSIVMVVLAATGLAEAAIPDAATNAYYSTRTALENLESNPKQARYRSRWEDLANRFTRLYEKNPNWAHRAAALYRSAEVYAGLYRRSFNTNDAAEAARRYQRVAEEFPHSSLAPAALLEAANLNARQLRDGNAARGLLTKLLEEYPNCDSAQKARDQLASLGPGTDGGIQPGKIDRKPRQPSLDTDKKKSNSRLLFNKTLLGLHLKNEARDVRLELDLDAAASWRITSQQGTAATNPRVILKLPDTVADANIPKVQKCSGMLRSLAVARSKSGHLHIVLEFTSLLRFTANHGNTRETIVFRATTDKRHLRHGKNPGQKLEGIISKTSQERQRGTLDMAAQLGLSARTIIIDAGHGGHDPGATGNGLVEKHVTLDITRRIARQLRQRGFNVKMTRTADVFIALRDRPRKGIAMKGDIFISVHVNASRDPSTRGLETYYLNFARSSTAARVAATENAGGGHGLGSMESMIADILLGARTQESKHLGYAVQRGMLAALNKARIPTSDGKVRSAPLAVLMRSTMPCILIETGYCSNAQEAARMTTDNYKDTLAAGVADGVCNYLKSINK